MGDKTKKTSKCHSSPESDEARSRTADFLGVVTEEDVADVSVPDVVSDVTLFFPDVSSLVTSTSLLLFRLRVLQLTCGVTVKAHCCCCWPVAAAGW